ncbi:MAG: dihydrofolate reductase family protein [Phormidesmis sp.]
MRDLTYYVACSVDGFIAHNSGSHDGFSQEDDYIADIAVEFPETFPAQFRAALNIEADNQHFDTVLMGRRTYKVGLDAGISNPYPHLKQYVFSRSLEKSPDEGVELVSDDAIARVKTLKNESGKGIWLCGGAMLATALFNEKLIDRLILKVNPFLMGSGISLFAGVIKQTPLMLTAHKIYTNGVSRLDYQIGDHQQ